MSVAVGQGTVFGADNRPELSLREFCGEALERPDVARRQRKHAGCDGGSKHNRRRGGRRAAEKAGISEIDHRYGVQGDPLWRPFFSDPHVAVHSMQRAGGRDLERERVYIYPLELNVRLGVVVADAELARLSISQEQIDRGAAVTQRLMRAALELGLDGLVITHSVCRKTLEVVLNCQAILSPKAVVPFVRLGDVYRAAQTCDAQHAPCRGTCLAHSVVW